MPLQRLQVQSGTRTHCPSSPTGNPRSRDTHGQELLHVTLLFLCIFSHVNTQLRQIRNYQTSSRQAAENLVPAAPAVSKLSEANGIIFYLCKWLLHPISCTSLVSGAVSVFPKFYVKRTKQKNRQKIKFFA